MNIAKGAIIMTEKDATAAAKTAAKTTAEAAAGPAARTADPTASAEAIKATAPTASAVQAKDHLSMAVVLSIASVAWFGWGHQGAMLEGWLRAGMVLAAVAAAIAAVRVRRVPAPPTLATDPRARRIYWIAVAAEVALIVLGAFVLAGLGIPEYLSTWTLFIVGVHFLPFVRPFNAPILRLTALACVIAAAVALWAGLAGWAPTPTIAGFGGGIVLLGFAVVLLVTGGRDRSPSTRP